MNNQINPLTVSLPDFNSVTDKYRFISTAEFIKDVESLGYKLKDTQVPRSGFGMHSLSFTNPSLPSIEGMEYRLFATNSHNGTSAFNLNIQVLRLVCSNGLIAMGNEYSARIVHRGYAWDKVAEAVKQVESKVSAITNEVKQLQSTIPREESVINFLIQASKLRDAKPYRLADLQSTRRFEDKAQDAWTIFNRVQESLIRGGYDTQKVDAEPFRVYVGPRARELKAVAERLHVNKSLWQLATTVLVK